MKQNCTDIELLAPARDASTAIEAIKHGADAVYIGAPSHGARAAATNSVADIATVAEFAHRFNARVYVTLNTLVYDDELKDVEKLIGELYAAGIDALIVQDMGILNLDIPPIALHASTQCDIRSAAKARFLQDAGFSQLVLPRELSIDEIREIRHNTEVPLEAFVHGALCVSYSGDCQASQIATGRSANRGCCAQICRLPYSLTDGKGETIIADRHLLSLRDMNRIGHLEAMINAGISSFKIEGRLKDSGYVKNTVAAYRMALDTIIAGSEGRLRRSSSGRETVSFTPDLAKSFNRGFTSYFIDGKRTAMGAHATPKWVGEEIGSVASVKGNRIILKERGKAVHNGDGLGFFTKAGKLEGFRVNRAEGNSIFTSRPMDLRPGTPLYRNHDKAWEDTLNGKTAERFIPVEITLRTTAWGIAADMGDCDGNRVTATTAGEFQPANTPQSAAREKIFGKLGDTIYRMSRFNDQTGDLFIPASILTALRREASQLLDAARLIRYRRDYRRATKPDLHLTDSTLTYHDNVANREAEKFYRAHGAEKIERAIEVTNPANRKEITVMTTRYCLRNEMGKCLRTPAGSQWTAPLYIQADGFKFRLDFDCANCRMKVIAER